MKLLARSGTKRVEMVSRVSEATVPSADLSVSDVRQLYATHAATLRLALQRLAGPGLDPDDLLHEVFVVALRKSSDLSRAQSHAAWLFGVATRVAATRRRTAFWKRLVGLEHGAAEPVSADSPARTLEQKEAAALVQRALDVLSTAKRETFVLFELQGLSGEETATALGIPLKTVWTRLFHARREFAAEVQRLEREGTR